jgi:acetolactate synthase I/II/III large subunit
MDSASAAPIYGSDLIVDHLMDQGIKYVALNPGASFRGLHDSLVNRAGAPEIIVCPHEKLAVNVAHGYAKACGEPMVAILHNVVGLLHGALGLFTAFLDRSPVIVLGGCGPMDSERRRPWIDWIHTANIQGDAVRNYTKWDDQPASAAAFGPSLARARRMALTEPAGPVYVALDADLQEARLDSLPPRIDWKRVGPGSAMAAEPPLAARSSSRAMRAAIPGRSSGSRSWPTRSAPVSSTWAPDSTSARPTRSMSPARAPSRKPTSCSCST